MSATQIVLLSCLASSVVVVLILRLAGNAVRRMRAKEMEPIPVESGPFFEHLYPPPPPSNPRTSVVPPRTDGGTAYSDALVSLSNPNPFLFSIRRFDP